MGSAQELIHGFVQSTIGEMVKWKVLVTLVTVENSSLGSRSIVSFASIERPL